MVLGHIQSNIDSNIIRKLLYHLPKLQALDFCGCASSSFVDAFETAIDANLVPLPHSLSITRLSLHECCSLPTSVFETLLPLLPHLTHLDVAHTRITGSALASIPATASLSHLNLRKCSYLSAAHVINFIRSHPAARSLIYLNLSRDMKTQEMLDESDLHDLLPILPHTLRALHLGGRYVPLSP
jgi:hypothetical protein